jgi:TP901 family phage tail tape measure protein
MADVESNINVNIDTSSALASIRRLQSELSAFHTSMAKGGAAAAATSAQLQQGLMNSLNATGQFTASMKRVSSTTESFTSSLEKNKLSMREYFRYSAGSFKTFSTIFTKEFNTIEKVARERVKTLQTQYIQVGRDASGAMKAIAIRPQVLDMNDLGTKTAIASQKMQILNQMVKQGSTNLLNFGKNTQWAGRQLMVGFSIPLGIAGAAAAREFMKLEEQSIRFKRVYGDTFTPTSEADQMVQQIKTLATEFTKYGLAVDKTMALAADAAAMGKQGADLMAQVNEASRLSVLGGVDQQQALETTTSLTNAFGIATKNLAKEINFLNGVENQTVTSIEDLTEAIPTAAPVIQQLGGNVQDLAFFLTAMREGGINASEGANALKSGLASMINPTTAATEMLGKFGINLQGIVDGNKGNVKQMILDLSYALNSLDPTNRAQAIEQLFGKFQFARMSTLFQNVTKEGSQASRVLELTAKSALELSILSQREMEKISESPMFKFQAAVEQFQAALAPLGEAFLKAVTPIIEFGTKILDEFNKMDAGAKNFVVVLAAALGGIAPILLMSFGLVANGVANLIKFFAFVGKTFLGVGRSSQTLGGQLDYMTQQQLEAAAVAASLDQSHNRLIQTFTSEAGAVNNLTAAYERAAAASARVGLAGVGRGVKGKKMATGGIISGPGGPTSDSVPIMASNGEAIISAKTVKKYPGMVSGLIAGNIQGFVAGGVVEQDYVNDPGQPKRNKLGFQANFKKLGGVMGLSAEADQIKAELLKAQVSVSSARKIMSRAVATAQSGGSISEFIDKMNTSLQTWKASGSKNATALVSSLDQKLGLTQQRAEKRQTSGDFAHIGSGVTMSAADYKKKYGTQGLGQSQINALEESIKENKNVSIKSGLGMSNFNSAVNNKLDKIGASQSEVMSAYKTAGVEKWNESIRIGGGNVKELAASAKKFDQEFQGLIGKVSKGTVMFDRQADADKYMAQNAGKAATSLEKLYAAAIKTADPKLQQALTTAQSTPREFRAGGKRRINANLPSDLVPVMREQAKRELAGGSQTRNSATASRRISEAEARASMTPAQKGAYTKANEERKKQLLAAQRRQIRAAEIEADIAEREAATAKRRESARKGVETRRANAEARAAAAVEQEAATTQKRSLRSRISSGIRGMGQRGGGMAGMGMSAAMMAGSMVGGPAGDAMGAIAGPLMGAASAMTMIPGPAGLVVGGLVAVAGAAMAINQSMNEARDKAIAFGNSLGAGKAAMEEFAKFSGQVSDSQIKDKERQDFIGRSSIQGVEDDEIGKQFLASEQGTAMTDAIAKNLQNVNMSTIQEQIYQQMTTAVATGAIDQETAQSIVMALGEKLGDPSLALSINARIDEVFGADGKLLADSKLEVLAEISSESSANIQNQIKSLTDTLPGAGLNLARISEVSGLVISMGTQTLEQQTQLLDSLDVEYEKRLRNATASGQDTTGLTTEYQASRETLLQDQRDTRAAMSNPYAKAVGYDPATGKMLSSANGFAAGEMGKAMDTQIETTYANDPVMLEQAKRARDRIVGSEGSSLLNTEKQNAEAQVREFELKAVLAEGVVPPETFLKLLEGADEAEAAIHNQFVLDIIGEIGNADGGLMVQMASQIKDGALRQDFELTLNADAGGDPELYKMYKDIYAAGGQEAVDAVVNFAVNDDGTVDLNRLNEIKAEIEGLQTLFESNPSSEQVFEYIFNSTGFNMTQEQMDYYNSLPPEDQKTYATTYLTITETIDANSTEGRARLNEYAKKNNVGMTTVMTMYGPTTRYDYDAIAAHQAGAAASNAVRPPSGGGGRNTNDDDNAGGGGGGGSEKAPRTIAEVIADQQKRITAINDQTSAVRKLVAAGLSLADAYAIASNAEDAALIAHGATTAQIAELTAKTREAEKATKDLAAAQKVANTAMETKEKNALATRLAADSSLTDIQKRFLLENPDAARLYMTPTLDPEALRQALLDAQNAGTYEFNINRVTIPGLQEIWKKGMSNAAEAFSAQENAIKINFDIQRSPFEDIVEAGQRAIADIQNRAGGLDDLDADLERISNKEFEINKAYDEKVKALDEVAKINDKIIAQQKSQLGLADALSRGDIAGAAKAAQDMRAQASAGSIADQKSMLDASRKSQIDALKGESGLTREEIEEKIRDLKQQILEIEEKRIEPAQRQMELLERMQQDQIDALTVLGKTREEWDAINTSLELANTKTKEFQDAMREALTIATTLGTALATGVVPTIGSMPTPTPTPAPSAPARPEYSYPGLLSSGSRGDTVKKLQSALNTGGAGLEVDGIFGPKTRQAVINFQTNQGIGIDGVVGPQTWRKLYDVKYYGKGGKVAYMSKGGKMSYMALGGMAKMFAKGTDTIPAMLSAGEFVMQKSAVDKIGVGRLAELNRGYDKNTNNNSDSVYNYSISVNASTNANPREIANTVLDQIKQIDQQRVRGNRFNYAQ